MRDNPLFELLDTSFVDLNALVLYLRRRNFTGIVCVAFNGYQAEIEFTANKKLRVSENDMITGQHSNGEKAFNNIVARTKVPGGAISVYHDQEPVKKRSPQQNSFEEESVALVPELAVNGKAVSTKHSNGKNGRSASAHAENGFDLHKNDAPFKHLDFPYELTNNVEARARRNRQTEDTHATVLKLATELLGTVDSALSRAELNFEAAFAKACSEVSSEFAFLDPAVGTFCYKNGELTATTAEDPETLVSGIGEALSRIFERLGSSPKHGKVYRYATQRVRVLNRNRREMHDRYDLTRQIEKILQT